MLVECDQRQERVRFGHEQETAARNWLEQKGYRFLDQNVRFYNGEIDLVMEQTLSSLVLVFFEIKVRRTQNFNQAFESLSRAQMRRLQISSKKYLMNYKGFAKEMRWDLMVLSKEGLTGFEWTHVQNFLPC